MKGSRKARNRRIKKQNALNQINGTFRPQKIMYEGRRLESKNKVIPLSVDVRNFIMIDSAVLDFAKSSGALNTNSFDEKAWLIQKMVCNNIQYIYDKDNTGYTEFWQFPFETMVLKYGDCEDGAILMASTMVAAGIPSDRVRVCAGWVETGNPTAPNGGHAYVAYIRNNDMKIVPLDWCYYADPEVSINHKPQLVDNKKYGNMWFSFNNVHSWGERDMNIERK